MLTKGETLGLVPIKCENKEGTEKLKEIHHGINDVLFGFRFKYIFQRDADNIFTKLCTYGKDLSGLEVPDKAKPKKNELLEKLRVICNSVNVYRKQSQTIDDVDKMDKALGYFVHDFIDKKDNLTLETATALLRESKELYDNVYPFAEHLTKIENFIRCNTQLITWIQNEYGIRQ